MTIRGRLYYLATPYSHDDPAVREERFRAACEVAGFLMAKNINVFSPIAHTHPIACHCDLPKGFDFWRGYDTAMISRCSGLVVVRMPEWEKSKGVAAEIGLAQRLGIPVMGFPYPHYKAWFGTSPRPWLFFGEVPK